MGLVIGRGNLGSLQLLLLFIELDNHQEVLGTDLTKYMVVHRETEQKSRCGGPLSEHAFCQVHR